MINEQLSAYLDGEASPQETDNLIAALKRDADLRDAFSRQHWLRHALREARPVQPDAGFSARVLARLDEQPAEQQALEQTHTNVVSIPRGDKPARAARRWQRPTAGLAIAASVVGALVLVGNPLTQVDDTAPSGEAALAFTQPANLQTAGVGSSQQVASASQAARVPPPDHWAVSDPALEDQLNGYLLEHDGVARGYGLSSATPTSLVRVATYGTGQ